MIRTIDHLCGEVLHIKENQLYTILKNINDFYYEKLEEKYDKRTGFLKVNKDGTPRYRIINPSTKILKILQKRISAFLCKNVSFPEYAYGGIKKKDNVLNAKKHQGKKYVFLTDMQDFFPFITHKMVYSAFIRLNFSYDIASILTKLTTYRGHLPQGAPTSSIMANLVFIPTGNIINEFAQGNGLTFTTFVDDITLSSQLDFKDRVNQIIKIINDGGFKISHKKTHYKSGKVDITGVKRCNNYITITDKFREKLRDVPDDKPFVKQGCINYKNRIHRTNPKDKSIKL